jgi:hypothetical protein
MKDINFKIIYFFQLVIPKILWVSVVRVKDR